MTLKEIDITRGFEFNGEGTGEIVESNAEMTKANFAELYPKGAYAYSSRAYTGQPTAEQTLEIGGDFFQFIAAAGSVTDDTYIAVLIGATARATYDNLKAAVRAQDADNAHATLFQTDDETPALANGTENVTLDHAYGGNTATGTIYLYAADEPGGTKVEGVAPDLALGGTVANTGNWKWSNLNLSTGAVATVNKAVRLKHTVVAGDLSAAQPLLVPIPFTPTSWEAQVRGADGQLKPDCYCALTAPAAVESQALLGLNLKPTPGAGVTTKRAIVEVPIADNDISIATWALAKSIDIHAISFSCGEDPASTLIVSIAKVTAATAGDAVNLTTSEDIAGDTQAGQITALTLDESGGDVPIAVSALQALLFTVTAGNGSVAPRSVTFYIDYVELCIATDVIHFAAFGA